MPLSTPEKRTGKHPSELAAIESDIQTSLTRLATIRDLDTRWSAAVRRGEIAGSPVVADQLQALYRSWLEDATSLLHAVTRLEAAGYTAHGSEDLRDAIGFCPAGLDARATAAAFRKLDRGEGIPVEEVAHGKVPRRRAS